MRWRSVPRQTSDYPIIATEGKMMPSAYEAGGKDHFYLLG
jgi:hypothetical protein